MKPKLTEADFIQAAKTLKCEVAAIKAVAEVESKQNGFNEDDSPVILFERHIFSQRTKGVYDAQYPDISNEKAGGYGLYSEQHNRLKKASELDRTAALMSASWGKFQIMGFNYALCGYNSLQDFINDMYQSESKHLAAFVQYVINSGVSDELQRKDWVNFARLYNGSQYKKNKYDTKLQQAYIKYTK